MSISSNFSLNVTRYPTPEDVPFYTIAVSIFMYSLIFMVGFFGNSLVIIVAYLNRTNQHSTHYCLVNLSIADLLLIIVCMPSAILDLFSKEVWYFGKFFCKIIPWLEHTVAHASILTIVSISVERSLAIALPLKAKQFFTNQRLWLVVVLIWVISTLSTIPIVLATSFRQAYHRHLATYVNICVVGTGQQWQLAYLYTSLFMFYLLPCFSLFVLYGNIVLIIKNRSGKKSVPHAQNSQSLMISSQDNCDKQKLSARQWRLSKRSSITSLRVNKPPIQLPQINHKQIIVLLIVMMLLIFVCLLPYRVFSLWVATASKAQLLSLGMVKYYNIITVCRVAFYTNSALNPIFYHIISTKFQTAFKRFFKFSHGSTINLSRVSRRSNLANNLNSHA
ncbi:growth hormone secretagogue receptor type 1 isoform X2 [Brachionus plicatilis]|uniref:Growth hormone secretagogue receptor type 1 isoform X2 n=1 Tax=Brachionus plicatilis TaxID=10195 RepID=A0A3M7QB25_BRAPC|nr:growth hormone secretagogue receptor type 1 isoform X2 [Brachionus plicatilis]